MSACLRANSAPNSSGPERARDTRVVELNCQVPAESRMTQPPPVNNHILPDELLVSLTSTLSSRSTLGHTAHHQHCKGSEIRRPDPVWHHRLGRNKYKFLLEQPTSLTGAGRDISFLRDAMATQRKMTPLPPLTDRSCIGDTKNLNVSESLIPEEYHIVKNKGLRSLEFFEDAFTVQLKDDEQKLRVFPSLRPSGRLEVIQLMRMIDDMLEKAGVDQQIEELTELSQMEGLLELVQVEQNIYNIVFHELIRQVSVGCAERGQLLAKLRQRYQTMLKRIPHRLKALHTEAVAQRALDRRLTEEIHRIKTFIQELNTELSRMRAHDASVSQQVERAHRQLAGELKQPHTNSDVVQGYHQLYELQRGRLEAQLLQMTEERDCWSQFTLSLALKVISVKKLQLISRLHIIAQSWFKTAEQCCLYLTSTDTDDLTILMELTDYWKKHLIAFMSQLKKTEHAQYEQISAIQQGIAKWLVFCTMQNNCPQPNYEEASLEKFHADLKDWSNTLALQCDSYQGEKLLCSQQTLVELGRVQERRRYMSLELFRRHACPDGEPREGQRALSELDKVLSELLKRLDTQVSGDSGIHGQIMSLLRLMESQASKLGAVIGRPDMIWSVSDWLNLEKALQNWKSLAEEAFNNISSNQTENEEDKNKPDIFTETEELLDKVQEFITSLSNFTDGENKRLSEEVSSLHMGQIRWMLDLLLLMVPEYSEDHCQEQEHHYITNISPQTLDKDAKMLTEKLNFISLYISSSCQLILQEQHEVEIEDKMNECRKLQKECTDWVESSIILLSGVTGGPVELSVRQADPASSVDVPVSPADSMETLVNEEVSAEPKADSEVTDETEAEPREGTAEGHDTQQEVYQGELAVFETPVVKLISYYGNITQRKLEESSVHLNGVRKLNHILFPVLVSCLSPSIELNKLSASLTICLSVSVCQTEELVVSPATDEAQKAFSDLTTVGLLQQELYDSELRVQGAERRAFKAEEALQAALEKIQDLERQLQGRPSLEPKIAERKKTPIPSPLPVTTPAPPKKTTAEAKPTSSTKKTKKR
ncbi:axonemal dynein light chain domain-containing protein 1 isoform X2 [Anarrhichthys ocellatus]|uniref:axonemal dynein light chain domain-containing protein 1 isoform X2 n=1 Tax=Anarrhichthys ocellatus TaxID=433405 RepID=UPI0012EED951|nr:axonemal dynein light chain domain-containing protein 1 isoform X2 [Anarrhichthys ocellatus]